MLILFDIDLTLIRTAGAGMKAMGDAGRELFGRDFDETRTAYAGRLDPLIIRDLIRDNGLEPTPDRCAAMRAGYARHLPARLASLEALTLPGVHELLARLRRTPQVTLGVLTGNFEETGRMKLAAAGVDSTPFVLNVWGDQSPHEPPAREHLPAVAIERYRCDRDPGFAADRVTIVGDTVHDVSCGLANGCRVLGVATGYTDIATLKRAGAHRVVPDLSDTEDVYHWLLHRD
ncbi:MAG: haloacid dehalogenase-like hydrolase [Phycisphaerales bacterium]|nr:haloacid dehalogenase-like hydrolase [Phycisphaerales bacterium]